MERDATRVTCLPPAILDLNTDSPVVSETDGFHKNIDIWEISSLTLRSHLRRSTSTVTSIVFDNARLRCGRNVTFRFQFWPAVKAFWESDLGNNIFNRYKSLVDYTTAFCCSKTVKYWLSVRTCMANWVVETSWQRTASNLSDCQQEEFKSRQVAITLWCWLAKEKCLLSETRRSVSFTSPVGTCKRFQFTERTVGTCGQSYRIRQSRVGAQFQQFEVRKPPHSLVQHSRCHIEYWSKVISRHFSYFGSNRLNFLDMVEELLG